MGFHQSDLSRISNLGIITIGILFCPQIGRHLMLNLFKKHFEFSLQFCALYLEENI
jgi:hypothetical protein